MPEVVFFIAEKFKQNQAETIVYLDAIYYSRYQNNIIATGHLRHEKKWLINRIFRASPYLQARGSVDTNHEFFNNIVEVGAGIMLIPNAFNFISISLEQREGYYLPVSTRTENPYSAHYSNGIVQAMLYKRF